MEIIGKPYDFILIDCMPSLGMLTINALATAHCVIIPVQAQYLPLKGLEQLLHTIRRVQRQINPNLRIEGILLTMVDSRTNYARDMSNLLRDTYGGKLNVFPTDIPQSVRAAETLIIHCSPSAAAPICIHYSTPKFGLITKPARKSAAARFPS